MAECVNGCEGRLKFVLLSPLCPGFNSNRWVRSDLRKNPVDGIKLCGSQDLRRAGSGCARVPRKRPDRVCGVFHVPETCYAAVEPKMLTR